MSALVNYSHYNCSRTHNSATIILSKLKTNFLVDDYGTNIGLMVSMRPTSHLKNSPYLYVMGCQWSEQWEIYIYMHYSRINPANQNIISRINDIIGIRMKSKNKRVILIELRSCTRLNSQNGKTNCNYFCSSKNLFRINGQECLRPPCFASYIVSMKGNGLSIQRMCNNAKTWKRFIQGIWPWQNSCIETIVILTDFLRFMRFLAI